MSKPIQIAAKYRDLFISLQKENNIRETINVNNAKWTMKDVLEQLGSEKELELLIKFFFLFSTNKTWQEFEYRYDEYYESLQEYRIARRQSIALRQQTISRKK